MPPLNLSVLLLPLIGGFAAIHFWPRTRFLYRKDDGHRLFLAAGLAGVGLLGLSRACLLSYGFLCDRLGFQDLPALTHVRFQSFAPFGYSGAFVGAFILGLTIPAVLVAWDQLKSGGDGYRYRALTLAAARTDGLLHLLLKAREEKRPVLIVLRNRKAYIGYVISTEHLTLEMPYFRFLPTAGAYLTEDQLRLQMTHVYEESAEALGSLLAEEGQEASGEAGQKLVALEVVLRTEEVVSASFFQGEPIQDAEAEGRSPIAPRDWPATVVSLAQMAAEVWPVLRRLRGREEH